MCSTERFRTRVPPSPFDTRQPFGILPEAAATRRTPNRWDPARGGGNRLQPDLQPNVVVLVGTRCHVMAQRPADVHAGHDATGLGGMGWRKGVYGYGSGSSPSQRPPSTPVNWISESTPERRKGQWTRCNPPISEPMDGGLEPLGFTPSSSDAPGAALTIGPLVLSRTSGEREVRVRLLQGGVHRGGARSGMRSNVRETSYPGDQVRRGGSRGLQRSCSMEK